MQNSGVIPASSSGPAPGDISALGDKSKYAIAALVVSGVACVVIVALGGLTLFGPIGSTGFIASIAVGGTFVGIAISGIAWIAVVNCKNRKQAIPRPINYNNQREHFLKATQELMEKKATTASFELPDCQRPGFQASAEEAFKRIWWEHEPPERYIQTFGGGDHKCVTTNKIPGVLFKRDRSLMPDKPEEYVRLVEKGREICKDHNLYLLYIPKCKIVDFDPNYVMEEKVEFIDENGSWRSQRSCYRLAMDDPRFESYIKELFKQLIIFAIKMKLADIKFDNQPIMKDGRVALIDLDESDAITGLTTGCARGKNGIFNMIPLKWFDEFVEIAKQHLCTEDIAQLDERLPMLRERARKREARIELKNTYLRDHQITLPTQPLIFDKKSFTQYEPKVRRFAEKIIQLLNQKISSLPDLSMIGGRKILIETKPEDKFFKDIVGCSAFRLKIRLIHEFRTISEQGFKALQEQGYIMSFKIGSSYYPSTLFSVVC
jgi:hypothetical protein